MEIVLFVVIGIISFCLGFKFGLNVMFQDNSFILSIIIVSLIVIIITLIAQLGLIFGIVAVLTVIATHWFGKLAIIAII